MIATQFDITKKPLNRDTAVYLVDYRNVELHRQYVENIIATIMTVN